MKRKYVLFLLLLINGMVITACSNSTKDNTISHQQKLEQLATLVATGKFLQTQCQRTDIPAEPILIESALLEAKNKGWQDMDQYKQMLQERAQIILENLKRDNTPLEEKCAYFNQTLVPFIEQARHIS